MVNLQIKCLLCLPLCIAVDYAFFLYTAREKGLGHDQQMTVGFMMLLIITPVDKGIHAVK